jgi:hypothetical protein
LKSSGNAAVVSSSSEYVINAKEGFLTVSKTWHH